MLSFKSVKNDNKIQEPDLKSCDTDPFVQKKQTPDTGERIKRFDVFP
jgi:hypothetical protein